LHLIVSVNFFDFELFCQSNKLIILLEIKDLAHKQYKEVV